jgi:predicted glycosyltransferase
MDFRLMKKTRLLIYSHDTFGLGHLRRSRTIAHSLVDYFENLSVLIVSGSPVIGSYSYHPRVDFVRIPGVVKLDSGKYSSLNPGIELDELISMRSSLLLQSAESFKPDVFLVDKEPLGLRGEVQDTLSMLKTKGVSLVLGLRDVMDEPKKLAEEWQRKNAIPALEDLYDHIWVYGLSELFNPLEGIPVSSAITDKINYTGYLRRTSASSGMNQHANVLPDEEPYILVTTGGGGDGAQLVDWVLRAYENDPDIPYPAKIVLGPFMNVNHQSGFMDRVNQLDRVSGITFVANIENLLENAIGVVSMGGYNIFCELLSFDKRGLILPRTVPRMEQYIRASRAEQLGLIKMMMLDDDLDAKKMADALHALPNQPKPSEVHIPGLLGGLPVINTMMEQYLESQTDQQVSLSVVG